MKIQLLDQRILTILKLKFKKFSIYIFLILFLRK